MSPEQGLPDVRQRFVYNGHANKVYDSVTGQHYPLISIARLFYPDLEPSEAIEEMLHPEHGLPRVTNLCFRPGEASILSDGHGGLRYNLWQPTNVRAEPGDVAPFLALVRLILDNDEVAVRFLIGFMAHMIQRPGQKMAFAVLIIGPQGIGKSMLGEMLTRLIGEANTAVLEMGALTGSFNGFLARAHLVIVNEFVAAASRAAKAMLKNLITAPTVLLNEKGVPAFPIDNVSSLLLFSNESAATALDADDRRYFVWRSEAVRQNAEFYADLAAWFDNGGDGHLLDYLQNFDLSGFNPHAAPPRTAARAELIRESMTDQQQTLSDLYEACEAPFDRDLAVADDVVATLYEQRRGLRFTSRDITGFFRSIGAVSLGQRRIPILSNPNYKPRVWALRNQDRWINASESEVAQAYLSSGDGSDDYLDDDTPPLDAASRSRRAQQAAQVLGTARLQATNATRSVLMRPQPAEFDENGDAIRF